MSKWYIGTRIHLKNQVLVFGSDEEFNDFLAGFNYVRNASQASLMGYNIGADTQTIITHVTQEEEYKPRLEDYCNTKNQENESKPKEHFDSSGT